MIKASAGGHSTIVDALIGSEAILNLKTTEGHTALTKAVIHQHPNIVSKLLLAGANLRIKDKVLLPTCAPNVCITFIHLYTLLTNLAPIDNLITFLKFQVVAHLI